MSRRYLLATVAAAALLLPSLARADSTVAALTAAAALSGPELFYCVQAAADHNCTATQLRTFIAASVGTVTSVGLSLPGGVFTVSGSPVIGSGTLTATPAGTSGGVPYFSSATSMASSGLLTLNTPVLGGGAGGAPTSGTVSGNTTKFATVNATTFATGQCVQVDASSNLTTTGSACGAGGGGTPGGSTTQLQYNNAGVFGGITGATSDGTNVTALSLTASASTSAFNLHGSAFTTTGININASGAVVMGGDGGGATLLINDGLGVRVGSSSTSGISWINSSGADTGTSSWQNVGVTSTSGIIEQRKNIVPQTYRLYNIFNTSSDYERGVFDWTTTANTLTIGTQMQGTGSARVVQIVQGNTVAASLSSAIYGQFALGTTTAGTTAAVGLGTDNLSLYMNTLSGYVFTGTNGGGNSAVVVNGASGAYTQTSSGAFGFAPGNNSSTAADTAIVRGGIGHLNFTSGTPVANTCAGFALTTGSTDTAGKVSFTSATSCSITFGHTFTNAPYCVVTPGSVASTVGAVTSTTGIAATFGTAQTAMQYHCFGT